MATAGAHAATYTLDVTSDALQGGSLAAGQASFSFAFETDDATNEIVGVTLLSSSEGFASDLLFFRSTANTTGLLDGELIVGLTPGGDDGYPIDPTTQDFLLRVRDLFTDDASLFYLEISLGDGAGRSTVRSGTVDAMLVPTDAVPLPGAALLFAPALVGGVVARRRKRA